MRGQSRFIDELRNGWWHPDVRPAVSRATYAAIAHAVDDKWAPGDIERALGKANNRDMRSEGLSNKFRKIWKDQTVPSSSTLNEVARAFPACQAKYWSEHPIFFLLDGRQQSSERFAQSAIHYALDSLHGPIRVEIWKQEVDYEPWTGRLLRALDSRTMLNLLSSDLFAELDTLDRLTLSTAFAKMALASEDWRAYDQSAWITSLDFGKAVTTNNPLLVGWKWLMKLFEEQLWHPHNTLCVGAVPISGDKRKELAHCLWIAQKYGSKLPPSEMFDLMELNETQPDNYLR
jgi:hypothetical protein